MSAKFKRHKTGNVAYKRNFEEPSKNHCYSKKAISITHSECVSVALGIQRVMHILHIILSSVFCRSTPYTSILRHKKPRFSGNVVVKVLRY